MFDLLDRPLVFWPVKWPGISADEKGDAVAVTHEVQLQIEILDDDEAREWSVTGGADPFPDERAALADRISEILAGEGDGEATALALREITKEQEALAERTKAATQERDLASFKRVVKGWRKVVSNGRPVQFTDDNILKLLKWPGFAVAFGNAYKDAFSAKLETREGNSEGSPANGPAGEPTAATKTDAMS